MAFIIDDCIDRQWTEIAEERRFFKCLGHDVEFQQRYFEQRLHGRDRVKSGGAPTHSAGQLGGRIGRSATLFSELDHPAWNVLGDIIHSYFILISLIFVFPLINIRFSMN